MRKIKFRAWDGEKMTFVTELTWTKEPVIPLDGFLDGAFAWTQAGSVCRYRDDEVNEFGNLKLLQYTGLSDSKGKEIWEGDILEFHKQETSESKMEPIREVVEYSGQQFIPYRLQEGEVIGNIYEHPDLLTPHS